MQAENRREHFFERLAADPSSHDLRGVFADWLTEQGEAREATWMMLENAHHLGTLDLDGRKRFIELDRVVDAGFRARVARLRVDLCTLHNEASTFEYGCPERWEQMLHTTDPTCRHCEVCDADVHFVSDLQEARDHASRGHCVALSPALPHQPGDLQPRRPVGKIRMPPKSRPMSWWRRLLGRG